MCQASAAACPEPVWPEKFPLAFPARSKEQGHPWTRLRCPQLRPRWRTTVQELCAEVDMLRGVSKSWPMIDELGIAVEAWGAGTVLRAELVDSLKEHASRD